MNCKKNEHGRHEENKGQRQIALVSVGFCFPLSPVSSVFTPGLSCSLARGRGGRASVASALLGSVERGIGGGYEFVAGFSVGRILGHAGADCYLHRNSRESIGCNNAAQLL